MPRRRCWFAETLGPGVGRCEGRLVRAHLLPNNPKREGSEAVWDNRTFVYGCGGPTGIGGHHGALDTARTLRVPRGKLPPGLEDFAAEHNLTWWIEREYR
jgi:hypothetical protein